MTLGRANEAAIENQGAGVPRVGFLLEEERPFAIQVQATVDEEVLDRPVGQVELVLLEGN